GRPIEKSSTSDGGKFVKLLSHPRVAAHPQAPQPQQMDPREFQLLLYCARSQVDAGAIRGLVNEGVNWPTLLGLAQQHGVRPMLLRSLKSVCWDAVPRTTQFELERFNRVNFRKTLCLANELFRLLEVFQQNGIPIATFKGPVLAESVYGDLSLRE